MTREPLAHVTADGRVHLLDDHLQAVSRLAREFGAKLGCAEHAALAGLWHDLGKYSGDFQRMIREANGFEAHVDGEGQERDHSTAGARHALERGGPEALPITFAIAGHHAGLADLTDLRRRLEDRKHLLEAVLRRNPGEVLEAAVPAAPGWAAPEDLLRLEFWTRMLFSALCDADFLDTEAFFETSRSTLRGGRPPLRELCRRLQEHLDRLGRDGRDTTVNRARREVQEACVKAAGQPPGVFSLTVPTGGGKTLASVRFGLEHALLHGLDRVVVVIPYTSIIEQNADVYRSVFGDDAVVEHHSALDPIRETARNRIACENWDAPVVVTTTVQLFESLLAARPARCRKLHRLARSVIVLDEAQALPGHLLPTILDVLGELVHYYGCTLVISTATQPALGRSARLPGGLADITEICPPELDLFARLKRVDVMWPAVETPMPYEDLAVELARQPSCLAVVHLRRDARVLCEAIDAVRGDRSTVHLSALMTPDHRARVLREVRERQRNGGEVRMVATQLVEAGVDLDFPVVYRALAGLDAIAQAAGRCNREGLRARGELRVFVPPTEPPEGVPRTGRDVTRMMRRSRGALDPFDPEAQREFFVQLYERTDLRRGNAIQELRAALRFREVASAFRLIEDDWSAPLVIGHGDGAERLDALRHGGPSRERLRALQRFTVNVPRRLLVTWVASGAVSTVAETVHALEGPALEAYDERVGLVAERMGMLDPAVLIVG